MRETTTHPTLGTIVYDESLWTSRKNLYVDGKLLEKIDRKTFRLPDGRSATVKGNNLFGAKLLVDNESIVIAKPLKWYEILLGSLLFVFIIVWGNVPALCSIFPIVGGAIGGLIGAFASVGMIFVFKTCKKPVLKIVFALVIIGLTILVLHLIGRAILSAIAN